MLGGDMSGYRICVERLGEMTLETAKLEKRVEVGWLELRPGWISAEWTFRRLVLINY